jgi:hypothetical protein
MLAKSRIEELTARYVDAIEMEDVACDTAGVARSVNVRQDGCGQLTVEKKEPKTPMQWITHG